MSEQAAGQNPDITALLDALSAGDPAARDTLFTQVYAELKRLAAAHLRRSAGASLNPTALLHEAWIKIACNERASFQGSAHFYNTMAQAMRQILIDLARRKARERHGVGLVRTELTERIELPDKPIDELLALDAALTGLRDCDAELAELVEWHSFAGIPLVDIARVRGVTERTAKRHWALARAFLARAMQDDVPGRGP
jgi:RNA polymerase sigma factor (TIGR02999 family)